MQMEKKARLRDVEAVRSIQETEREGAIRYWATTDHHQDHVHRGGPFNALLLMSMSW